MRFPHRERHQLFLEPEGLDIEEIYVNGFSMSLPADVQERLVRALPGLEACRNAAPRLRRRVPTSSSRRSSGRRSKRTGFPGCFWRGRSTARPATRRRPGRASSPASTRRVARAGAPPLGAWPRRGLHRHHGRRPGHARAASSRTGCSPHAPSTGCCFAIDNADLRLTPRGRQVGLGGRASVGSGFRRARRGTSGTVARCRARWCGVDDGERVAGRTGAASARSHADGTGRPRARLQLDARPAMIGNWTSFPSRQP